MPDVAAAPAVRPASTVVLVREAAASLQVYLVKRHGRSGFMAGAHVFPGGRVDEDDDAYSAVLGDEACAAALARVDGVADERTAVGFCVAAVRETAEECGVLLANDEDGERPDEHVAAALTAQLREGRPFAEALRAHKLVPDVAALIPIAWWITPEEEPKRYDTRFFVAPAPAHRADVDDHETTEGEWFEPTAALAAYARAEIALAPPTLVTLEDLCAASTLADAAQVATRPLRAICPKIISGDDGLILALPGDPLHKEAEPIWATRTRVIMNEHGRFASALAPDEAAGAASAPSTSRTPSA